MKTLIKLFQILLLFHFTRQDSSTEYQYCDDCPLHCCNVEKHCATTESSCYCLTSSCSRNCCFDNKCGSEDDCNPLSVYAVLYAVVALVGLCVCCFIVCLGIANLKRRRNAKKNLVSFGENQKNSRENHEKIQENQQFGELQSINTGKRTEGVPVENVFLGQLLEFPETSGKNNEFVEGEPIILGEKQEE